MRYSDIVQLRSMRPAYNIKEEGLGEWKTFIANDQFNDILNKMIKAVRNNDADHHKSVWIAGTYGTGKSHAGAVLKHLFCDPLDDIQEYVEDEYKNDKYALLRSSIISLRQHKRLFPVNLYGQQSIAHEEDLSLQLQKEIRNALNKAGINITVKTDFDMMIQHIDEQPAIWRSLIDNNTILSSVAPDLKKLRQLLCNYDTEVLDRVRNAQRIAGIDIRLQSNNIQQWIFEVQNKLKEQGVYDGLLIIWDEFTEIMTSSIGVRLLVRLQEVAEAMMNVENDSYFLFISHPSALNTINEAEREKTKGRYHYVAYNMEPVSAFKIMSKKFKVVDDVVYNQRKSRFFALHGDLLKAFSSSSTNASETIENIQNLYPLHPSAANMATYYAREAGSSSRSVFEFLACDAVKEFLDCEDNYINERTITADFLWDYVKPYFESDTAKFGAVTERYNSHHLAVEAAGDNYSKVFKGILLLNALNNIANSDTVTPSQENIENLFVGTEIAHELIDILDFLNDKSIIQRQPNGNFSILFTALPGDEIQKIKEELMASSYLYTDQVVKFGDAASASFDKSFKQIGRPLAFQFFSKQANEYTLLSKIENTQQKQSKSYELFLAILVGRNQDEIFTLKDIAERNSNEDRFRNTTFVVMEAFFEDKNYERFIEYQANAQCAQRRSLPNQQKTYEKNASDMIDAWATRMKGGNATFYLRGESMTTSGSKMASTINNSIAPCIFEAGPEALEIIRIKHSTTYWKKASVKATVDAVLSFNTKQDIIAACGGPARHVEFLLQDSVDDNLDWKNDVDPNHPLKMVCDYIDEWLSGRHTNKNQTFNLGEKLIGLTEAPYGLFQGYAPMAMVAFAMRKYVNQIFDTNGKQRTSQHLVDDVVELFKAWESGRSSNKLNFMFESKEAGKLSKYLIAMFSLKKLKGYSDISSLKDARWAIQHEYAKEKGYPLWSLKYCSSDYNTEEMRLLIDNVIRVVNDSESMKNPALLNDTISGYETQKFEWGNLIVENNGSNYRNGFNNFLKSVEIVNIQDSEIEDAFAYLKGHLEGEIGLWKEADVKDCLKDWRMSTQAPPIIVDGGNKGNVSGGQTSAGGNSGGYVAPVANVSQKRSQLKEALKFMPPSEAKDLLNDIIEAEDIILDILLKYLK